MDVFKVHGQLIDDYRAYTSGAVPLRDRRIHELVSASLESGEQWPDPWISLNPSFAAGGTVADLVAAGELHPACAQIFRTGKTADSVLSGNALSLYRHQKDALDVARTGQSYVLTTGTGSGKSLSYILPIVDAVLRERDAEPQRKGVRAIIVYPMNALANSQQEELGKFLTHGFGEGREKVTFARYTGQEKPAVRQRILADPPDILLTNYVMLELMLTRPKERSGLITAAQGLRFLVLDELHTYRGRQGADVAMLVRRVRDACRAETLQCVGTSATMASGGTTESQRAKVAEVAGILFDADVPPGRVIGETLVRATDGEPVPAAELARRVGSPTPAPDYATLAADPLARWIEDTFGLVVEPETGDLVRRKPTTVERAAAELAALTGKGAEACAAAIRATLDAGAQAGHPVTGRPLFAFRLHQFLSKGETVYASVEPEESRHLTRDYQLWVPGEPEKLLLPLTFCRQCGQEYLTVARDKSGLIRHRREDDEDNGYLYVSADRPWPAGLVQILDEQRLPDSWLTVDSGGVPEVVTGRRKSVPVSIGVLPTGEVVKEGGVRAAYVPVPFGFCLACGVSYEQTRGSDFAKLATLDREGRSSAVSVLSASIVRSLKEVPAGALDGNARKLLTFVDNRQDASLQSGHFNDFAQVSQLRGALYRAAVERGGAGLAHEEVAQLVTAELGLAHADYAANPGELTQQRKRTEKALRDVVAYRLYLDLERGWRVTMPNLEQTGLITIAYPDLAELCALQDRWEKTFAPLRDATAAEREKLCRILLDELRRVLAIDVDCLTDIGFEEMTKLSRQHLRDPWALPERELPPQPGAAFARTGKTGGSRSDLNLSGRGSFGRHLRRPGRFSGWPHKIDLDGAQQIISDLIEVLAASGLLTVAVDAKDGSPPGYRINSAAIAWLPGEGKVGAPDPLRWQFGEDEGPRVNPFFVQLYRQMAIGLAGLHAREHTAQVPGELREEREKLFRTAELPLLYCSPTMELGVDIAGLNAVAMRNVPPTPANYAQRSGRAGRSGQPALVTTYCASGNSHDRYYFRRSQEMVSGTVAAPRLDLANEDLVRSHVHAIWLAETGIPLGKAMNERLIDLGDVRGLPLRHDIAAQIDDPQAGHRALERAKQMLARSAADLAATSWWDGGWLLKVVKAAPRNFDDACDRWRELYRRALAEQAEQNQRVLDQTSTAKAKSRAKVRRAEAETQLRLLLNEQSGGTLSDFNPYRYLASEGFLPGYSFPRLPLAAYIPGRDRGGDYLQRSRFIAIREYGPGALIYHEGSRFQVKRVQIPTEASGELSTGEARRCVECGYHHTPQAGLDLCVQCGAELPLTTHSLMHLHTVFTERRQRISSDEEERRKAGFDIEISYSFSDHGERSGRLDATVSDADGGALAALTYGDSATVRLTNLGPRRRKDHEKGFWLDTVTGSWIAAKDAVEKPGLELTDEETGLEGFTDVKTKIQVIPYVEDRRNVLVLDLAAAVPQAVAVSLQYALERGVEAVFQLEDAELDTELLPPDQGPDRRRMLFIESAEGGAGVLRRLQNEPDALAQVAREALRIAHFDAGTGADLGGPAPGTRCEKGCYDCLLSFSNQLVHHLIDRHLVRDLLVAFAGASAAPIQQIGDAGESRLEGEFVTWLKEGGYRLPDEQQVLIDDALAQPDYVYRLPGGPVAVFIDGPHHDDEYIATRDEEAEERLANVGWHVVRFRHDGDWRRVAADNPSVFGPGTRENDS